MLLVEPKVSEAAKYFRNNYLAVKVALANEFYALCQTLQIEYNDVKDAMLSQGGIEPGHLAVPGPDGKLGFSGMCLPKDIRAMIKHQEWLGLFPNVLEAAEETNQSVRPHDSLCRELA
jgi:UDP-glucose 6-dehydrogenase